MAAVNYLSESNKYNLHESIKYAEAISIFLDKYYELIKEKENRGRIKIEPITYISKKSENGKMVNLIRFVLIKLEKSENDDGVYTKKILEEIVLDIHYLSNSIVYGGILKSQPDYR
ncbi:MAG: hypothetical protein QXU40_04400 [Candidatus Pacearchaeota archaeon]